MTYNKEEPKFKERRKEYHENVTFPANIELELEALAKVIQEPSFIFDEYLGKLVVEDFWEYGNIFNIVEKRARNDDSLSVNIINRLLIESNHEQLTEDERNALSSPNETVNTETCYQQLKLYTKARAVIKASEKALAEARAIKPMKALKILNRVVENIENLKDEEENFYAENLKDSLSRYLSDDGNDRVVPTFHPDLNDAASGGFPVGLMTTLLARPSMGKALRNDQRVLTTEGAIRIENLNINHRVYGSDGKPHHLLGIFPQGVTECQKVVFNDGTELITNPEHLWKVYINSQNKPAILTTANIKLLLEKKVTVYLPPNPAVFHGRRNFDFPEELLGMMTVACYTLASSTLIYTCRNRESAARFTERVSQYGGSIKISENISEKRGTAYTVSLKDSAFTKYVFDGIREHTSLELFKIHLVKLMTTSSIEQRGLFIQGMIDARITLPKKDEKKRAVQFYISSSIASNRLVEKISNLIRSIGLYCAVKNEEKYFYEGSKAKIYRNVRISGFYNYGVDFCSLPGAADRIAGKEHNKPHSRKIVHSVDNLPPSKTICISIDTDDQLFLAQDYTLTHNTRFLVASMLMAAKSFKEQENNKFVHYFAQDGDFNTIITGYLLGRYGYKLKDRFEKGIPKDILERLKEDIEYISTLPIVINNGEGLTPNDVRASMMAVGRRMKKKPGLVVADYLQVYKPDISGGRIDGATERTVRIVEQFYSMVRRDDDYALVIATQLPKKVDDRKDPRPKMSDGKNASEIEERSELMLGLYRESYYSKKEDNTGEILVLKNKTGALGGVIPCFFEHGIWIPREGWTQDVHNGRNIHTLDIPKEEIDIFDV